MKFNICTLIDNGFGLQSDYGLLRRLLEEWGHEVHGVKISGVNGEVFDKDLPIADVNIFLELLSSRVVESGVAKENWFVPNQEWYHARWDSILPYVHKILCKTYEAVRVFTEKAYGDRCIHVGWESKDLYDPTIPRQRKFLHVAGGSANKNSEAVAFAFSRFYHNKFTGPWNEGKNIPLVLVSSNFNHCNIMMGQSNCTYVERATDEQMKHLMNECIFHIMPSAAEGWGHVIHEGLGCGAVMLTTDFPPMNEYAGIDQSLLIHSQKWEIMNQVGRRAWVGAYDLKTSIDTAWGFSLQHIEEIQRSARRAFLEQRESFRQAFKRLTK